MIAQRSRTGIGRKRRDAEHCAVAHGRNLILGLTRDDWRRSHNEQEVIARGIAVALDSERIRSRVRRRHRGNAVSSVRIWSLNDGRAFAPSVGQCAGADHCRIKCHRRTGAIGEISLGESDARSGNGHGSNSARNGTRNVGDDHRVKTSLGNLKRIEAEHSIRATSHGIRESHAVAEKPLIAERVLTSRRHRNARGQSGACCKIRGLDGNRRSQAEIGRHAVVQCQSYNALEDVFTDGCKVVLTSGVDCSTARFTGAARKKDAVAGQDV